MIRDGYELTEKEMQEYTKACKKEGRSKRKQTAYLIQEFLKTNKLKTKQNGTPL